MKPLPPVMRTRKVDAHYIGDQPLLRMSFCSIRTAALAKLTAFLRGVQEETYARCKSGIVVAGGRDAALAQLEAAQAPLDLAEEVDHPADGSGDDRDAGRHRLEDRQRRP